jgi:predicted sulfurtransferase
MGKILLYYKYVDIQYPEQVRKWQVKLCMTLNLKGRVLIAHEGINGTVGGSDENLKAYVQAMNNHPLFGGIDFKESSGSDQYFPRLRIVIRPEIVSLGIESTQLKAADGGKHLTPSQAHDLLSQKPEDLVILDARNWYESQVGSFENAITPNTKTFRELPAYIDQNLDQFKEKQVLMYCTGGVRCERASAYLKSKNVAKEVYQIEGGIHRYVEQFPDGFFRGKNYVFDGRVTVKVNDDVLALCTICSIVCDEYTNCINASCNLQFVACKPCLEQLNNTCSTRCFELINVNQVPVRTKLAKMSCQL